MKQNTDLIAKRISCITYCQTSKKQNHFLSAPSQYDANFIYISHISELATHLRVTEYNFKPNN
jgi:hypothetical protein